jgi:hypothetical protein
MRVLSLLRVLKTYNTDSEREIRGFKDFMTVWLHVGPSSAGQSDMILFCG